MNKDRRKRLEAIREKVEEIKTEFESVAQDLIDIGAEEQEAFDNMNEGLQASETGQRIEAAADALSNAVGEIENVDLQAVLDGIDEAAG